MPESRASWLRKAGQKRLNPATTYLERLSPGSRRALRQALDTMAAMLVASPNGEPIKCEDLRWEQIGAADAALLRKQLADAYAPATANKMLSALRGVLRACLEHGLMGQAQFDPAVGIANVPAAWQPPAVDVLSASSVRQLFRACAANPNLSGRRDAALLAIFLGSGLRRSEAAALDVGDFDSATGELRIGSPEPRKSRTVYLRKPGAKHLLNWLKACDRTLGPASPLLLPVNKSGRSQPRRLTDQAIYNMIRGIGAAAGLPSLTSRALRLTYVVTLIARGLPLQRVQELVGHASWLTTSAYARMADQAMRNRHGLPPVFIDLKRSRPTPSEPLQEKGPPQ